jgi:hypothetical protein
MSPLQLSALAVIAMLGLATLRVARVHLGREPLPDGRGRLPFLLGFLVLPPIVVGALVRPAETDVLRGTAWVPEYVVFVSAVAIFMGVLAVITRLAAPGRTRRLLLLGLAGNQGDPFDVPFDPPITAKLAATVGEVDRANVVFPRGLEFPMQINRAGFRSAWDALDAATVTLETAISDDHRLGRGVASEARATATDARSRLDTLHRLAVDDGQVWPAA